MESKICTRCKIEKNINDFYFIKVTNKHNSICKKCNKINNDLRIKKHFFKCEIHGDVYQGKQLKHCTECKKIDWINIRLNKVYKKNLNFSIIDKIVFNPRQDDLILCNCKIHGNYYAKWKYILLTKYCCCNKCRLENHNKHLIIGVPEYHVCKKCNIKKHKSEFYIRIKNNGYKTIYPYCRVCDKLYYTYNSNKYKLYYDNKKQIDINWLKQKYNLSKYKNKKTQLNYSNCDKCKMLYFYNIKKPRKLCLSCNKLRNRLLKYNPSIKQKITEEIKLQLFKRFNFKCYYCNIICETNPKLFNTKNYITIDHIIPLSKGGNHSINNLVPACRSCNSRKSNRLDILPIKIPYKFSQLKLF